MLMRLGASSTNSSFSRDSIVSAYSDGRVCRAHQCVHASVIVIQIAPVSTTLLHQMSTHVVVKLPSVHLLRSTPKGAISAVLWKKFLSIMPSSCSEIAACRVIYYRTAVPMQRVVVNNFSKACIDWVNHAIANYTRPNLCFWTWLEWMKKRTNVIVAICKESW